jgi:hypothetical protein
MDDAAPAQTATNPYRNAVLETVAKGAAAESLALEPPKMPTQTGMHRRPSLVETTASPVTIPEPSTTD